MTRKYLICKECGKLGDPSDPVGFVKDKKSKWGVMSLCFDCYNKRQKAFISAHPGYRSARYIKNRSDVLTQQRDNTHKLPTGWFRDTMESVNGLCMICGRKQTNAKFTGLCVDHDHKTGDIRGLLCSECNQGLGKFKDNPEWLRAAAIYLEKQPMVKRS